MNADTSSIVSSVDTYEPKELVGPALSQTGSNQSESSSLARARTNMTELSQVLSAIRDDREQDRHEDYAPMGQEVAELNRDIARAPSRMSRADIESVSPEAEPETLETEADAVHPPDSGYAWFMAICGLLAVFSTWGSNASYGVFLSYYQSNDVFHGATEYDYALIGGLVMFCAQFLAPFSIMLYQVLGFRPIMIAGVLLQTAGYILASFATKLWQLYLTQGLLVGVSFVLVFLPATLIVPSWFDKYLSTCMGIMVSGAGVGGLVFSLSLNKVIEQTGDQRWAIRMVGIVCGVTALIPTIFLKSRTKPAYELVPIRQKLTFSYVASNARIIFDWSVFKNYAVVLSLLWFGIALLGYTLMLYTIASYARSVGLTAQQGSSLTSIMNAAQIIGRPTMGITADAYTGRSTFAAGTCAIITIFNFAWWIPAHTYAALIAFVIFMGFIIGVGSTLAQSLASDCLRGQKVASAWSGMNMFTGITTLVAEVIALALVRKTSSRPYLHTQIFSGCCYVFCTLVMLGVREYLVRRKFVERRQQAMDQLSESESNSDYSEKSGGECHHETPELLQSRVDRYNALLKSSVIAFVVRTFYPIKA
ncbi:probable transporter Mch2p [Diutina catenulata]